MKHKKPVWPQTEVKSAIEEKREALIDTRPACLTCTHWQASGICHRFPPMIHVTGDMRMPSVGASDWCGEWKKK